MGRIVDASAVKVALGLQASCTEAQAAVIDMAIGDAERAVQRHIQYDPVKQSNGTDITRTEFYPKTNPNPHGVAIWEANDTQAYQRHVSSASSEELQIRNVPIRSITSLFIDYDGRFGQRSGSFAADTEKNIGDDVWPEWDGNDDDGNPYCLSGILRSEGLWPDEPGSVKIVYISGYSDAEFQGQVNCELGNARNIWEVVRDEAVNKSKKVFVQGKGVLGFTAGPKTSERMGDYAYTVDSSLLKQLYGSSFSLSRESCEKLEEFVNWGISLAE